MLAWEAALQAAARDGQPLPADVRWCVEHLALVVPATAARCPAVRAALPPDVRDEVAAASQRLAARASQGAGSQVVQPVSGTVRRAAGSSSGRRLSTGEAARVADRRTHAIRAACRRGRLAAVKDGAGQWQIDPGALEEYVRRRGR